MDVDSDSGGSFIVNDPDFETGGTQAARGKGKKAVRWKEKGKGKAKEVGLFTNEFVVELGKFM